MNLAGVHIFDKYIDEVNSFGFVLTLFKEFFGNYSHIWKVLTDSLEKNYKNRLITLVFKWY